MLHHPMGSDFALHFLIAHWFSCLLLDHRPNYFPFTATESMSELNSPEEELFHVLIINLKIHQHICPHCSMRDCGEFE